MTEAMDDVVEAAARRIYEDWQFGTWEPGDKPKWQERGNSVMQDLARSFARTALAKLDAGEGLVEELGCALLEIEKVLQATPERGNFVDDLAQQHDQALIDIHEISQSALAKWRAHPSLKGTTND